jgi:hypothetical protein
MLQLTTVDPTIRDDAAIVQLCKDGIPYAPIQVTRKNLSDRLGADPWILDMFSKFAAEGFRASDDPLTIGTYSEDLMTFESKMFFVQTQREGVHWSVYIYVGSLETYSLHVRLSSGTASIVGLYPNTERAGWNLQGIQSVGRYLLRVADWICTAFGCTTMHLLDCSTVSVLGTKVRLPMLMKMATNKTYYEGSGYGPVEEAGLASGIRYYRTESDMRRVLGDCFEVISQQLLQWAGIQCGCNDLLVCDYASIVLEKVFLGDVHIMVHIRDILSTLQKKFGYIVRDVLQYRKKLPCSYTKQPPTRRTRRVRPYYK